MRGEILDLRDLLKTRTTLTAEEQESLLQRIRSQVLEKGITGRGQVRQLVASYLEMEYPDVKVQRLDALSDYVFDELFGLGPLECLLQDPEITDIMIAGKQITVTQHGTKEELATRFKTIDDVKRIIDRITGPVGKRVDIANPFCDCKLPDGSRCHIIIPPAADNIYITIRKLGCMNLELADWVKQDVFSSGAAEILEDAIRNRKNILISGGTGAGKTTLLNSLVKLIQPDQLIITLEDTYELQLPHLHVKRLLTRQESAQGAGEITFRMLLKNALRMNPDRIIMGEVRDECAYDLLHALNIGHRGSLSTIHANSILDALWRLETLALTGAPKMPLLAIKRQISRVIDLVIQLQGLETESGKITRRKLTEMALVETGLSKSSDYVITELS